METLRVRLKVVSPLFMYGADQNKPEIRAASLKGALRFWYRAIVLGRLGSWQKVLEEEARLFGSAKAGSSKEPGGQARFMLKVKDDSEHINPSGDLALHNKYGLLYLGYRLMNSNRIVKPFIEPGRIIDLVLAFRSPDKKGGVTEQDIKDIELALQALCFFGAVGSRSRRGFGSLNIVHWEPSYRNVETVGFSGIPDGAQNLKAAIVQWAAKIDPVFQGLPEYSAFSSGTHAIIVPSEKPWFDSLNEIGKTFLRYRTSGQRNPNGTSADPRKNRMLPWREPFEPRFWDDHENVRQAIDGQGLSRPPRRVVFGLPHNYFFGSTRKKATIDVVRNQEKQQRRASPLFIHLHEIQQGDVFRYAAVLTVIPARFLPEEDYIVLRSERTQHWGPDISADYTILENLLQEYHPRLEVF